MAGAFESGDIEKRVMEPWQAALPEKSDKARKGGSEHADFKRDKQKRGPAVQGAPPLH